VTSPRGAQPSLPGEHVRLRPWRADDAGAVFAACQDPQIQRWTQVPVPYRREDAEGFVGPFATQTWAEGGALFAVEPAGGGELVGSMGLHHLDQGLGAVGYWTAPAARGRGLTAEALRVLSRWAVDALGATRLEALVLVGNEASLRVAARAGYRVEGVLRRRFAHRGERVDVVMTALLDTDLRR
jgi:RimJ/RimL family protein N-acetyltransferase